MKKEYWSLILIIIILAIIGTYFITSEEYVPNFGPVEIESGSITVDDQYELDQVYLEVESSEPGFVAIYGSMGEAPGETIGVSDYFIEGEHQITIALDKIMIPGLTYITILHVDDGDDRFSLRDDHAAMVEGEVVRPSFDARSIENDNQ
ncbi:hypothetical protein HN358_04900 [Candidatus Uhrbacteria bacterium]|jgi:hypothetical protein|nr:hypothetical protein [Candidatus Uhrbacteria bacterium]MBT7716795.1 hypothetical protein [Candidatus Uhrbacteria bacterium]